MLYPPSSILTTEVPPPQRFYANHTSPSYMHRMVLLLAVLCLLFQCVLIRLFSDGPSDRSFSVLFQMYSSAEE